MNILITGGTGFIGTHLRHSRSNDNFTILSRQTKQDYIQDLAQIPDDAQIDGIINLAGAPINKKWNDKNRENIINSRLNSTMACGKLITRLNEKPKFMLSASAIGFYGSNQDEILTENSPFHIEFTHDLCARWEECAQNICDSSKIPLSILRFGVVLAKNGGAYPQMSLPIKCGIGGKIGTGKQYLSWIYIDDAMRAINHIIDNKLTGIYNITAPEPITNLEFTKIVAKRYKRPSIIALSALAVRFLFGEMGEALLLNGQRVFPQALLDSGFEFKYPTLSQAVKML